MRTIIVQEVQNESGTGSYWQISEDGRVIHNLCADEVLWAFTHALMEKEWPYKGGRTVQQLCDENCDKGYRQGVLDERNKRVPPDKEPDEDLPF